MNNGANKVSIDEIYIPQPIKSIIDGKAYSVDDVGMSKSRVILFDDMVLKIGEADIHTAEEVSMMRWLSGKASVPRVIEHIAENGMSYLLMSRIKGRMACDEYYLERPEKMVKLLAVALRSLWSVDISDCPVSQNLDRELKEAEFNVRNGLVDVNAVQPETFGEGGFKDPEELLEWLKENKPPIEPVLSHGDFCLPNIFFDGDNVSGYIDIGNSGVGDKWRDVSLCYRSLKNNMNGGYGGKVYDNFDPDILFDELKIEPNHERLRYWLLLDELF